jgi:hypothetical protein
LKSIALPLQVDGLGGATAQINRQDLVAPMVRSVICEWPGHVRCFPVNYLFASSLLAGITHAPKRFHRGRDRKNCVRLRKD